MLTIPHLFKHSVTFRRYSSAVDGNYTPNGSTSTVATSPCYVHEFNGAELAGAGALGTDTVGKMVLPYGVGPVVAQDLADVTFRDGTTQTFRVAAIRDDHIMQTLDLARTSN